jgi:hypothetical protein
MSPVYCAQPNLHCAMCGIEFAIDEEIQWHDDGMIHPRCLPKDAA